MGLPSRSFAADAHDCIMVWIRMESTEYKCVARRSAPDGELPSDHHADTTSGIRRRTSDFEERPRLAVHSPFACSGVKALRNTSLR